MSSQHQRVAFTAAMFVDGHDAEETRGRLTLDASQKVASPGQLPEHMEHKPSQICWIISSSRVGMAQGHKQPRGFWGGEQNLYHSSSSGGGGVQPAGRRPPRCSRVPQDMKEALQWFYWDANSTQ